jgi:hypothetical protein
MITIIFRLALRNILKNKAFALINSSGLAVGLTASWINPAKSLKFE